MAQEIEEMRQNLEKLGVDQVRLLIAAHNFPTHLVTPATEWLGAKDREDRLRAEAALVEQTRVTRRTLRLAGLAAGISAVGVAIGAIGVAIALLAWRFPR